MCKNKTSRACILCNNKAIFILFFFLIIFGGFYLYKTNSGYLKEYYSIYNAVSELKKNHEIKDKELVFFLLPKNLKFNNNYEKENRLTKIGQPIYYDKATFLNGEIDKENDKIFIEQRVGKIFFKIKSKTLSLDGGDDTNKMGKLTLVNKTGDETIYEYVLDDKYKKDNLLFIIWDAKNKQFLIMNRNVNFLAI
ncbi:MAG: hypothetical protein WC436_02500 [Candidatus Babeliales bacterium]